MSLINAVIQGLIQGFTEFLPISSSGHLSVIQYFTGTNGQEGGLFTVLLHFGTLIAVFIVFRHTILQLIVEFFDTIRDLFTGKFSFKNMKPRRRMLIMLILAELPLLIVYPLKDFVLEISTDNDILIEGLCFLITATILYYADTAPQGTKKSGQIKIRDSLTVGAFQAVALMPGISRSGSTISGGLLSGFTRETAVEFSFVLGIPAVLAANIVEIKDAVSSQMTPDYFSLLIGMTVALVSGVAAIKLIAWLVKTNKLKIFSYYLFVLGCTIIVYSILEKLNLIG